MCVNGNLFMTKLQCLSGHVGFPCLVLLCFVTFCLIITLFITGTEFTFIRSQGQGPRGWPYCCGFFAQAVVRYLLVGTGQV